MTLNATQAAALSLVLEGVRAKVRMAHDALTMIEVQHGIRLLNPSNGLGHELRELHWAIATLNGLSEQPAPMNELGEEVKRVLAAQHRPETALTDPLHGLDRPGIPL
jgi:hypothetical protein